MRTYSWVSSISHLCHEHSTTWSFQLASWTQRCLSTCCSRRLFCFKKLADYDADDDEDNTEDDDADHNGDTDGDDGGGDGGGDDEDGDDGEHDNEDGNADYENDEDSFLMRVCCYSLLSHFIISVLT